MAEVRQILDIEGIRHGILWDRIDAAVKKFARDKETIHELLIARGTPPRPAIPSLLIYHPKIRALDPRFAPDDEIKPPDLGETSSSKEVSRGEQGNIDFRKRSSVLIVKRNMVLAVRRPAREGSFGTTVRGDMVPFETKQVKVLEPGSNVEERENHLVSTLDGRFVWNEKSFGVSANLEISGDVGYKTGNIRFPGNVIVKGRIQDRFSVWAGGGLQVIATLDCWDVFSGGPLEVAEGIIGRGQAQLRTKNTIQAKFIENCNVDTLGAITVVSGIMNSQIFSNARLQTGDRGRIVGGLYVVRDQIDTFNLGNTVGLSTEVILGVDFVTRRKIEHFRAVHQTVITEKMTLARDGAQSSDKKIIARIQELSEKEAQANEQIGELLPNLVVNTEAMLLVRGTLYTGVSIQIGDNQFLVPKNLNRVIIRFDSKKGAVVFEPISGTY